MFNHFLEFLFSLKNVQITSRTHFAFVWDFPVLITLGAIALAILGYVCYFPQSASPRKKRALGIVRAWVLVILFILCFRPQLVMEYVQPSRAAVAIWLDTSSSMQLQDPYPDASPALNDLLQKITDDIKARPATSSTPSAPGPVLANARPSRFQLGTAVLAEKDWLKNLAEKQDILFYTGGSHAIFKGSTVSESLDSILARLKADQPTATSTDVPTVVRDILANVQGERLSAIILLTDGRTTEPGSQIDQAAEAAKQALVKVVSVRLGQSDEPFDLKIGPPNLPQKTFIKDPVSVRVHITGTGITRATPARISIFRQPASGSPPDAPRGQPLATKDITLEAGQKELDADVVLKLDKTSPDKQEEFKLFVRVDAVAGGGGGDELYTDNNQVPATITVLDTQINVLYVEGYPRWEFRYLKNELIREPTVNVASYLLSADSGFVQDADPPVLDPQTKKEIFHGSINQFPETKAELDMYDVLILGDVEPTFFTPTQQRLIVDWVKTHGGGMLWIAGSTYNPESYRTTPMEVLLPIIPDEIGKRIMTQSDNTPFNLVLTPAGKSVNLFRFFEEDNDKSWAQVAALPQMYWYKPVQGVKPGAIVFATHPTRSQNGNPAPLLVMRPYGAGPVMFSAYCDTWRWRRYTGEPLFQSYWLQLCRLLYSSNTRDDRNQGLLLAADSSNVEIGGSIHLTLSVKDPTLAGQLPADIPVRVIDSNFQVVETITLNRSPNSGQPGTPPGTPEAAVDSGEGSTTASRLGAFPRESPQGSLIQNVDPLRINVEAPRREQEIVTTDSVSLAKLGTPAPVLEPTATDELAKLIPDRSLPVLISTPEELWNKPFALILMVLLVSIEWLIRKSAGLI